MLIGEVPLYFKLAAFVRNFSRCYPANSTLQQIILNGEVLLYFMFAASGAFVRKAGRHSSKSQPVVIAVLAGGHDRRGGIVLKARSVVGKWGMRSRHIYVQRRTSKEAAFLQRSSHTHVQLVFDKVLLAGPYLLMLSRIMIEPEHIRAEKKVITYFQSST